MNSCPLRSIGVLMLMSSLAVPLSAQSPSDRERQQLTQMQQMIQKLQQENAELRRSATLEVDKARSEARQAGEAEAAKQRSGAAASQRESRRLSADLVQARQALEQSLAEAETLKVELARRDEAQRTAAAQMARERSSAEADRSLLANRLKLNAQRADRCEAKHAEAIGLAEEVLAQHEQRQLRACEPFTGLWRVREEDRLQGLRDRLFEARLEVPAVASEATKP